MRPLRVTIMGLGLFGGGAGALRYWCGQGADVTVTDLRSEADLSPTLAGLRDLTFRGVYGEHPPALFTDTDLLVANQAIPPSNRLIALARERGVPVTTELELVFEHAPGPLLCITGSNGKSTTGALLHAMIRAHDPRARFGGNIGVSLLPELGAMETGTPLVMEVSSFQIEYLSDHFRAPDIAIITNLSPNHLDRHGTEEAYYAVKRRLFEPMAPTATWVWNGDDPHAAAWSAQVRARGIRASLADAGENLSAFFRNGQALIRHAGVEEKLFALADIRLPGAHNAMNALEAACAAQAFGVPPATIAEAVRGFMGLPHRMERVGTSGGIVWINDSDATTPESAICGLSSLSGDAVIIAGGVDKGMDFAAMGAAIAGRTRAAVLIGRDAPVIEAAIRAADPSHPICRAATLEEAMDRAESLLPRGGTVLFSPACASFDMFRHFAERGDRFRELVRQRLHPGA